MNLSDLLFGGDTDPMLMAGLLGGMRGMGGLSRGEMRCFSEEKNAKCSLAEKGELRGRQLNHAVADEHIEKLQRLADTKLKDLSEKQRFTGGLLEAAKEGKLPPYYIVGTSAKKCSFVETAKMLEKEESRFKSAQIKSDAWAKYKTPLEAAANRANEVAKALAGANEAQCEKSTSREELEESVKRISQGALAQLKEDLQVLEKMVVDEQSRLNEAVHIDSMSFGPVGLKILKVQKDADVNAVQKQKKVANEVSGAVKELKEYISLFENSVIGINAALAVKD